MILGQSQLRLRHPMAALHLKAALLRLRLSVRGGFDPDQPRDDRGRWALVGGRLVRVDGRWTSGNGRRAAVVRRDRTGNDRIDTTSDRLLDIAQETIDEIGPGSGKAYGILVHKRFADKVRALDLPGIGKDGVEQSFSLGDTVRYGLDGSVRTDIALREGRTRATRVISVWDLKTGSARLNPRRVREIRDQLGLSAGDYVFELKITNGVVIKNVSAILYFA